MCTPEEIESHLEIISKLGNNDVNLYIEQLSKTNATLADTVSSMHLATNEENDTILDEFAGFLEILSNTLIERYLNQVLSGYRLIEHIGSGASSIVFKAQSVHTPEKFAAIKIIYAVDGHNGVFVESSNLALVEKDPRFVKLYNSGVGVDGHSFIIMDYLDADNLDEWATRQRRSVTDVVKIVAEVADALGFAYKSGIVHGDMKPSHIKVGANSSVCILDLGVSVRGHSSESLAYTHGYASPQRVRNEPLSAADDVYSIGVLLRDLLDGDQSCNSDTERNPPIYVAKDLQNIIRKCLAAKVETQNVAGRPDLRYANANLLYDDLVRFLQGRPVRASDNSVIYRCGRFLQRNRLLIIGVSILCFIFISVFVALFGALKYSIKIAIKRLGEIEVIDLLGGKEKDKQDIVSEIRDFINNLPFKSDRTELLRLMADFEGVKLNIALSGPVMSVERLWEIRQNLDSLAPDVRNSRACVAIKCAVLLQNADWLFDSDPSSKDIGEALADARALLQSIDSGSLDVDLFPLHAAVLDRTARLRVIQQRLTEADDLYAMAEDFRRKSPESRQRALRLAISLVHRGDLRMSPDTEMTDRVKARKLFVEARSLLDGATKSAFCDIARAVVEERLGQMLLQDRSVDLAAGHFCVAEDLYRRLLQANPQDVDYQFRLAVILQFVGDVKFEKGFASLLADRNAGGVTPATLQPFRESRQVHHQALTILASMPDAMRSRISVLEAKMELLKRLATSARALSDPQGQREFAEQAKQIAEELFTRNPQAREARQLLQAVAIYAEACRGFEPSGVRESLEKILQLLRLNGAGRGKNTGLDECYAEIQELLNEMTPKELSVP
jgi:serine/threonine protein kinase